MFHKIVIASGNTGKIAEIQSILESYPTTIIPQSHFNTPPVAETGLTFVENALIKARHAATHTQLPSIADDSGLEVEHLAGEPGIYSARYAGDDASDEENVQKLLKKLHNVEQPQRKARFFCAIVFMRHANDPTPVISQGHWDGYIDLTPQGKNGFGYDPIFFVPGHQCCAAELSAELKNSLSHRSQALRSLAKEFDRFF